MIIKKFLKISRFILENLLPISFSKAIIGFYGFVKPATRSFSQKGEDILVDSFFQRRNVGYYLDIGCFHPKWISNTHLLHNKGWRGTVVDLDNYKLKLFKRVRKKRVQVLKRAIVGSTPSKSSVVSFYSFRTKLGWSDVDTLSKDIATEKRKKGWGEFEVREIKVLNINDLLSTLPHVNFLNIDVEGLDTEIVLAIDLDKYKIDLILFEDNTNFGGSDLIKEKFKKNGYEHLFTSGGSVCFYLNTSHWSNNRA